MHHQSGSTPLPSATLSEMGSHQACSLISYYCIVCWRVCIFGSACLACPAHFICSRSSQIRWVLGAGYFIVLILFLSCSWVGHLPSFPHHHHQAYSNTTPATSPNVADREEQDQFSCSHTLESNSFALTILLFCPGEVQDSLSGLLHLVRAMFSKSTLIHLGLLTKINALDKIITDPICCVERYEGRMERQGRQKAGEFTR